MHEDWPVACIRVRLVTASPYEAQVAQKPPKRFLILLSESIPSFFLCALKRIRPAVSPLAGKVLYFTSIIFKEMVRRMSCILDQRTVVVNNNKLSRHPCWTKIPSKHLRTRLYTNPHRIVLFGRKMRLLAFIRIQCNIVICLLHVHRREHNDPYEPEERADHHRQQ